MPPSSGSGAGSAARAGRAERSSDKASRKGGRARRMTEKNWRAERPEARGGWLKTRGALIVGPALVAVPSRCKYQRSFDGLAATARRQAPALHPLKPE